MASSISAGTTSSTALVATADTSGALVLQTNNGTNALTLSTAQVATFAGTAIFPTTLGVGNATPSTSGSGITFPATQSASSDANTLDDYEEGTWTPTDASGASLSFTSVNGYYTKIGNMVYLAFRVTYPTTANGTAGAIGGFPFSTASLADAVWGGYVTYTTYTTAAIQFLPSNNGTFTNFFRNGSTNGPTNVEMTGKALRGVIIYQTA
jgi:hypothetical protein